jgi:hypothetical protein
MVLAVFIALDWIPILSLVGFLLITTAFFAFHMVPREKEARFTREEEREEIVPSSF